MKEDIEFKINRENGKISGFTLQGTGETEAEAYCLSFVAAQNQAKARIEFRDGKIVFIHNGIGEQEAESRLGVLGYSGGGMFSADITAEDAKALSDLLSQTGEYVNVRFRVRYETAWAKGFTLYAQLNGNTSR